VRIISGKWKGRKLRFPADRSVRPTLERARITLFNWLAGRIEGRRCLDLYAGSGALGFEAQSRGASQTTLIEQDARTVASLREYTKLLADPGLTVLQSGALEFLERDDRQWDIVFVDPPYDRGLLLPTLQRLSARLAEQAFVYCESRELLVPPTPYLVERQKKLADTCMTLLSVSGDAG
jgi:16S rRNA (guanine966-N2)-methyltransferase